MKTINPAIQELKTWLQEKKEYEFFQLPGCHHERVRKSQLITFDQAMREKNMYRLRRKMRDIISNEFEVEFLKAI